MPDYFENRETISFYILRLNFSIETKIKTSFLISHFNLSKKNKTKWHFRYTDYEDMADFQICISVTKFN